MVNTGFRRALRAVREREARLAQGRTTAPVLIGSERDAAEAYGEESDLHKFTRSFFRAPRPAPLILTRSEPTDGEVGNG